MIKSPLTAQALSDSETFFEMNVTYNTAPAASGPTSTAYDLTDDAYRRQLAARGDAERRRHGAVRADVGADEPDVGALPRRARVKQSADPHADRLARHRHADGGADRRADLCADGRTAPRADGGAAPGADGGAAPRADSGAAPRADGAVPDGDIRVGAVRLDRR